MRNHWSVTLKTIVIAFCLVTEKTQCSPILKSRRSVIDTDTTNRIFLNDPADLIAFEDVDNEIPTNSFPPSPQSFFPIIEDGSASEEYGDKIQFTGTLPSFLPLDWINMSRLSKHKLIFRWKIKE